MLEEIQNSILDQNIVNFYDAINSVDEMKQKFLNDKFGSVNLLALNFWDRMFVREVAIVCAQAKADCSKLF